MGNGIVLLGIRAPLLEFVAIGMLIKKVGWFNYLHQDNDFGNKEDTAKAIKLIQDSADKLACKYYLDDYRAEELL